MMEMSATLTLKIILKWRDSRLSCAHLARHKKSLIPDELAERLWLPIKDLHHVNAIVGRFKKGNEGVLSVLGSNLSELVDIGRDREDILYKGSDNILEAQQDYRVEYSCTFDVSKYPFDTNHCDILMVMKKKEKTTTELVIDNTSDVYTGSRYVDQFYIQEVFTMIDCIHEDTGFILTIVMNHTYTNQMLTIFFPSFLLWLLAYCTFYIHLDDFNDRFMGSVTSLLVLAAHLSSIINDLP